MDKQDIKYGLEKKPLFQKRTISELSDDDMTGVDGGTTLVYYVTMINAIVDTSTALGNYLGFTR